MDDRCVRTTAVFCDFLSVRRLAGVGTLSLGICYLLLLSGCVVAPMDPIPGVEENVAQGDVPVPRGFYTKPNGDNWVYNRFASGPARFRSFVGEYVGYKQVNDLVPWYLAEMTEEGWLHRSTDGETSRVLTFTNKNEELATVALSRVFSSKEDRFQTVIRVEIGPLPTESMPVEDVLEAAVLPRTGEEPGAMDTDGAATAADYVTDNEAPTDDEFKVLKSSAPVSGADDGQTTDFEGPPLPEFFKEQPAEKPRD